MTKKELIRLVSSTSGITESQSRRALSSLTRIIGEEIKRNKKFELRDLGTFKVTHRKPRRYYSPVKDKFTELRTPIHIKFKASIKLRNKIK